MTQSVTWEEQEQPDTIRKQHPQFLTRNTLNNGTRSTPAGHAANTWRLTVKRSKFF
jgi:hypothetical protein